MAAYIFKGHILDSGKMYEKGSLCPKECVDSFLAKGVLEPYDAPVAPKVSVKDVPAPVKMPETVDAEPEKEVSQKPAKQKKA